MKSLKSGFLLLLAFLSVSAFAQTADDIITKHITAIGGKDKISQIKTIQIESTMSIMGNEAPMTTTVVNGKGFKNELDFNGTKITQVYTDKGGWSINPMMGSSDPTVMPDDQYKVGKDEIFVGGPLLDYTAKGNKAEYKGTEKLNNTNAYKVVLTDKDNAATTFYFDPSTYYILKVVRTVNMGGQEGETSSVFSDYKKTDFGYVVPYSVETTLPQVTMTTTVKKVEINKDVDPKVFDMPKQ